MKIKQMVPVILFVLGAVSLYASGFQTLKDFTGVNKAMILGRPDIQKDIGLSKEQLEKMSPLIAARREMGMVTTQDAKAADSKILDVLSDSQKERLNQIALQISGGNALMHDPELKEKLKITEKQIAQLQAASDEKGSPLLSSDDGLKVLNQEQAAKFKEMLGKPFVSDMAGGMTVRPAGPPPGTPARPKLELLKPGTMAPDFTALTPDGKEMKLSDLRGKIVVIDFWATWCGPCIASFPGVNEVANRTKDQNVVVLALCVLDKKPAYTRWIQNNSELNFKFAYDPAGEDREKSLALLYGCEGIPTKYVIDPTGKIIAAHIGSDAAASTRGGGKVPLTGTPDKWLSEQLKGLGVKL